MTARHNCTYCIHRWVSGDKYPVEFCKASGVPLHHARTKLARHSERHLAPHCPDFELHVDNYLLWRANHGHRS